MKRIAAVAAALLCLMFIQCGKKGKDGADQTDSAAAKPATLVCFTIGDNVNVRSAPSVDAESIEKLPVGTRLDVVEKSLSGEEVTVQGMKGRWLLLSRKDSKPGYVFSKYVKRLSQIFSEQGSSSDSISGAYDWGWGCSGSTDSEYVKDIFFDNDHSVVESSRSEGGDSEAKGRYQKYGDYLFLSLVQTTDGGKHERIEKVLHFVKCPKDDHDEMLLEEVGEFRNPPAFGGYSEGSQRMYYVEKKKTGIQ